MFVNVPEATARPTQLKRSNMKGPNQSTPNGNTNDCISVKIGMLCKVRVVSTVWSMDIFKSVDLGNDLRLINLTLHQTGNLQKTSASYKGYLDQSGRLCQTYHLLSSTSAYVRSSFLRANAFVVGGTPSAMMERLSRTSAGNELRA